MRRIGYRLALLTLLLLSAAAEPPEVLRRGINVTNWFRFPPSRDPAALRRYLDNAALRELRRAGFSFVRLPVQADLVMARQTVAESVARIQRHGLAVVVALFGAGERDRLLGAWRALAPALRPLDPALTFVEVLNEPVFAGEPTAWARLQHEALVTIRAMLPHNTVVLTGADWGSISGLLALAPEADRNVVYSFHLYEPAELTALGAYRPGLDATAMARLPFPVTDPAACAAIAGTTADRATAGLMRFYCAQQWDTAKLTARIAAAAEWGRRHGVPVLAGELGAAQRLNQAARLAWLRTVREACERQGLGWALWGYDDTMGFGVRPGLAPRRLDPALITALGLTDHK